MVSEWVGSVARTMTLRAGTRRRRGRDSGDELELRRRGRLALDLRRRDELQGHEDVGLVALHFFPQDDVVRLVGDDDQPRAGGGDGVPGDLAGVEDVRLAGPNL